MSSVVKDVIRLILSEDDDKERFLDKSGKPSLGRYTGALKGVEGFTSKGSLKGYLSRDVVQFLIKKYAKGQGLKWVYADLKKMEPEPGFYSGTYGAYDYPAKELMVNRRLTLNQFQQQVDTIIHEIQHFNQHMSWDKGDMETRKKYVKGKALPPGIEDEWGLMDLKAEKLHAFWEQHYGYENAPQEKDARTFAKNHLDQALDDIVKKELGIPEDPDLHVEVEASRGRFETLMQVPPKKLEQMKKRAANDFIKHLKSAGNLEPDEIADLEKNVEVLMTTDQFRYWFKQWMNDKLYRSKLLP